MKRSIIIVTLAALILLSASLTCYAEDSLDFVKKYKPEVRKYKPLIKSTHFVIEVYPIDTIKAQFTNLVNENELPFNAKGCKDGKYTGETPEDAFDYRHIVEIEIKNEKIVSVDYDEVNPSGKGKQSNEEYNKEMLPSGSNPETAYPIYEKQLLEKQDMMEVDAVSGASYSLYRFRLAMTIALMKASMK